MEQNDSQASSDETSSSDRDIVEAELSVSRYGFGRFFKRPRGSKEVVVAVVGCSHGEMDKIYATIEEIEYVKNLKIDLLICCGDFQTVRNYGDLAHMRVPQRYRQLQTFHRYYSGEKKAPVPTLFVGGNHEASGYLQELPYGGWVAPNIYYMGHASVVQFAGLRIGGLSGIYKYHDFNFGHFERPPFTPSSLVSVFHTRSIDTFRLKQMKPSYPSDRVLDIMISHDWPAGITDFGNVEDLLKWKPHFKDDIEKNMLGSPNSMSLLHELKPRYWFAAHLHCNFAAVVPHPKKDSELAKQTKFLSLDKVLPGRKFIQLLKIEVENTSDDCAREFSYDPTWLAVLKSTDGLTSASKTTQYMPSRTSPRGERWDFRPTPEELAEIEKIFASNFKIPENFCQTAGPCRSEKEDPREEAYYRNPQTTEFCSKLGIKNLNEMLFDPSFGGVKGTYCSQCTQLVEEDFDDGGCGFLIDRKSSKKEENV